MDDLTRVRDLYGEPGPDPALKARVGALIEAEARRRLRVMPWTAALVAAAVAAGVVVALPGGNLASGSEGRSILLAAAVRAESGDARAGAYWRVRKLVRERHPEMLGGGANRYWMIEPRVSEQWVSRGGRVWSGTVTLGAEPATRTDEAAWRRDGSPGEWPGLSTAPGRSTLTDVPGGVAFSMAGQTMTFAQIRALPADPVALRENVAKAVRAASGPDQGVVADALSGLLWSKPSPPEVRAAAYRALADLPEVEYLGRRTDESGRTGAAFSFELGVPAARRTLIIDTGSSQVLSSTTDAPGVQHDQVELVLEAGWTDERPTAPEAALPTGTP
ncbi:hypothetical protein Acor_00840 [Acrocarpospora corrugata]|uniref:CU044_5270 family protein n=1 Tax=Acrocarpospora corrugata TaxID=35763 RepID=A0A5M3VSJ2_9ACTN|nr:CU044_5270 family protein [Acrocarpospora corrugata]GER98022.1 hypothetical protein Acor_00840 [Acrocarpospora corrugata]